MLKLLLLSLSLLALTLADISVPPLDGRIVGGSEVSITKHPHQVSMRLRGCPTCQYSHYCGGSIYNASIIVTAAHCVRNRQANNFMIVAGTNLRSGADGAIAPVKRIIMHEKFNPSSFDNDVALMVLAVEIPLDNVTMKAIKLASKLPEHGTKSIVTGWGRTTEGGFPSDKLLEVEVPIISNEPCNIAYEGDITESMLCAGVVNGGKDACQSDSGGPLVVGKELAGIVSWGNGCARPEYPGVYASVPHLKDWIEQALSGEKSAEEEGDESRIDVN